MTSGSSCPTPRLFETVRLRDVALRNRLVVSPMCQYSAQNGQPGDYHLVHLGRFALGGFGLVMAESTAVHPAGRITSADLGIWDEAHTRSFKRIAQFIHDFGAAFGIQLGHAGHKAATLPPWVSRQDAPADAEWTPVSCTDRPFRPGWHVPRALEARDLAALARDYRDAALRANEAGADVLELHMAHGYLLHSFLSPLTNTRTDSYGGDLSGRTRFPLAVIDAVRQAWPAAKPLFVRLSIIDNGVDGLQLQDSVEIAQLFHQHGVDLIDCSSGGIGDRYSHPLTPGYQVAWAKAIRTEADVPTMAVGLIFDADQAQHLVSDGAADLVALGREALVNPSWPIAAQQALGQADPRDPFALLPVQSRGWVMRRQVALDARRGRVLGMSTVQGPM